MLSRTTPRNTATAPASGRSTSACSASALIASSTIRNCPPSALSAPPLTGGISATLSRLVTGKSACTYSAFTAYITDSRIPAACGKRSNSASPTAPAVAGSANPHSVNSRRPTASASAAKSRTLISMPPAYRTADPASDPQPPRAPLRDRLTQLAGLALDLTLPSSCASCGAVGAVLCNRCRPRLRPADGLRCPRCWLRSEGLCNACLEQPPTLRRLRSAFLYGGAARDLVLTLKYSGVRRAAGTLVAQAAEQTLPAEADLIAPIPMTAWRRRARGGNHAEYLARALSRRAGPPLAAQLLERRGLRSPQQARSPSLSARRANVRGVFRVPDPDAVRGRDILLVDDVATTMATLESAADALLAAGATAVDAWTAAREELRD